MGNSLIINNTYVQILIENAPPDVKKQIKSADYQIPNEVHGIIDFFVTSKTFQWIWADSYNDEAGAPNKAYMVFNGRRAYLLTLYGAQRALAIPPNYRSANSPDAFLSGQVYSKDGDQNLRTIVTCIITVLNYTRNIESIA